MELTLLKNLNALYAEDNPIIREQHTHVFESFFGTVYTAEDGMQALKLFQTHTIHVVITDIRMPIMDGLTLVREIRKENPRIPAFITTAYAERTELLQAVKLQLTEYLLKPLTYDAILQALTLCLKQLQEHQILEIEIQEGISYSPVTRTLNVQGEEERLPNKESQLLELFLRKRGRLLSKEEIVWAVYEGEEPGNGALKNLILRLRQYLPKNQIASIRNGGYLFT